MGYERKYNAILLVGLTELKAQIGWTDPETVRGISFNLHSPHLISIRADLGGREKVCNNAFRVCLG